MDREFEPNIVVYIVVLFFGSIVIGLLFGAVRRSPPHPCFESLRLSPSTNR